MRGGPWKAAATAVWLILASAGAAVAQPLAAPVAVKVDVHEAVRDTRFVPLLLQRLSQTLAPPVEQGRFALDLAPFRSALPVLWPADAQPLLLRLGEGVLARGEQARTHVFVIDEDIRLPPARASFAASFGSAQAGVRVTIVSLARLRTLDADGRDPSPALTAQRAFKLAAKNVARLAGHAGAEGRCLFAFPNHLAELDATPENFCEPDLGILVQAGIARPEAGMMPAR